MSSYVNSFKIVRILVFIMLMIIAIAAFNEESKGNASALQEDSDDEESNEVCMALFCFGVLIIPVKFLIIMVHELGHNSYHRYYQMKGIDMWALKEGDIREQPFGKMLMGGYRFEKIYILAMFFVLVYVLFFRDILSPRLTLVFVVSFYSVIWGTFHLLYETKRFRINSRYEDKRKLDELQAWLDRGCECGSHDFDMGIQKLTCAGCRKVVDQFGIPKKEEQMEMKVKVFTPAHLNLFYLFSRLVPRFTYNFTINASREKVFRFLVAPPSPEEQKKFKIRKYRQIDESNAEYITNGFTAHSRIVEKVEPVHLFMEYSFLGEKEYVKYFIYGTGSDSSSVLIVDEFELKLPTLIVKIHFWKRKRFMKKELEGKGRAG